MQCGKTNTKKQYENTPKFSRDKHWQVQNNKQIQATNELRLKKI